MYAYHHRPNTHAGRLLEELRLLVERRHAARLVVRQDVEVPVVVVHCKVWSVSLPRV